MKVGDHIKHVDDNTGQGPDGSWIIDRYEEDTSFGTVIYFSDESWCELGWIQRELEIGNAVYIPRGNGIITHRVNPHKFQ